VQASEQNLIDCNRNDQTGNFGCKAGSMASAYMHIQLQPGIASSVSYPYKEDVEHTDIYKCQFDATTSVGTTTGYARILPGNETLLRDVVASVGPVAFGMNAGLETFVFYSSGIYDDPNCTPGISHSALIYGYGTARYKSGKTVDYWLCKVKI
jgi:cathepsin L